jgi:acetyl-CoA carboxylase biotin carboxyl carrier protein
VSKTKKDQSKKMTEKVVKKAVKTRHLQKNIEGFELELDHLQKILELLEKHEVSELEWEKNGERIKLKTHHGSMGDALNAINSPLFTSLSGYRTSVEVKSDTSNSSTVPTAGTSGNASTVTVSSGSSVMTSSQKQVASPFVGTFYRSPSPDLDPYVKEGQSIKRGDVLCIIEAMKLMNEIEAEISGKIVSVLVENGQPVEFGEPLFIVEP